jgi:hypothetical protein
MPNRKERHGGLRRVQKCVISDLRLTRLYPIGAEDDIVNCVLIDRKSKMGLIKAAGSRKNDEPWAETSKLATRSVKKLGEVVKMNEPNAGQ